MIHPDTRLTWINPTVGIGVIATAPLPRGTITWARDPLDRVMTADEIAALPEILQPSVRYRALPYATGERVLLWDHAWLVNHDCRANTLTTPRFFDVAVRDIAAGEQLTNDYAAFDLDFELPFDCVCGRPECRYARGEIDVPGELARWDGELREALARMRDVPQALGALVREDARAVEGFAERFPPPNPSEYTLRAYATGRASAAARSTTLGG